MQHETPWGFPTQMLRGFEPTLFSSAPKGGRPPRLLSHRLPNLAWLRHLLDALDNARQWSGAEVVPANVSPTGVQAPSVPPAPVGGATGGCRAAKATLLGTRRVDTEGQARTLSVAAR